MMGIAKGSSISEATPIEAVLKRDRTIVMLGLGLVTALSWFYMFHLAREMQGMDMGMEMAMPRIQPWAAFDFVLMFVMWSVMMVAMMVPSAASLVLLYAGINRRRAEGQDPLVSTTVFLLGYLVVWCGFSAVATLAQWGLHTTALLSPMMASSSPILGGVMLLAAGIFQWTPLKHACLARCRSPLGYLMTEWRDGPGGAFLMGLKHGNYCTVCCWALMSLMFVAGVMSLFWMAVIAGFVLLEKVAPPGRWISRVSGLLLAGWGILMIASA
jgi:predicted metal-binding membrane protein